jgi:hypothetical protein
MSTQNADERDIGWRSIEEAEGSGVSLVSAYLSHAGYEPYWGRWGREYGRAVYDAYPGDVDLDGFIEERIAKVPLCRGCGHVMPVGQCAADCWLLTEDGREAQQRAKELAR